MKRKDYLITIIADGTKESFLASANSKKEAINKVSDIVIKSSIYPYKSLKEFEIICKQIKIQKN